MSPTPVRSKNIADQLYRRVGEAFTLVNDQHVDQAAPTVVATSQTGWADVLPDADADLLHVLVDRVPQVAPSAEHTCRVEHGPRPH
jgi:hypothetical protein